MVNYVQEGSSLSLAAPYNVLSGGGALIGNIFGVAADDVLSTVTGVFVIAGVFDLTKATGAVSAGQLVYWDDSAKVVTTVSVGNNKIGVATTAALSGDATARVRLDESASVGGSSTRFKSTEQTGTGSTQNVAHGMGVIPGLVMVYPSDTSPATAGVYTLTEGTHTTTNVVVTVTSGKKFFVVAFR